MGAHVVESVGQQPLSQQAVDLALDVVLVRRQRITAMHVCVMQHGCRQAAQVGKLRQFARQPAQHGPRRAQAEGVTIWRAASRAMHRPTAARASCAQSASSGTSSSESGTHNTQYLSKSPGLNASAPPCPGIAPASAAIT